MCFETLTFYSSIIASRFSHQQGSSFTIQWICWIWIPQQLGEEHFKYVDHIEHGGPGLIDDIETDTSGSGETSVIEQPGTGRPHCSSMFGWKILLTKPMEGDLYGYWSGNSTWTFHLPSAKGATPCRQQ